MIRSTAKPVARPGIDLMRRVPRTTLLTAALCLCFAALAASQSSSPAPNPATAAPEQSDLQEGVAAQLRELRMALDAMRDQVAGSRRESEELRQQLQEVRQQLQSLQRASPQAAGLPGAPTPTVDRLDVLAEEQELLRAKVDDQEQTKIESAYKYHVRLSGLALLNVVSTRGSVDNLDLAGVALPRAQGDSAGSFTAGVRQSFLGLEVFGPTLGGARTTGGLTFDFFGGFPATSDGVSAPLVRLKTATFTLEWKNTSIMAGQDVPFLSPRSPTSLTSTAYPALSSAGNLWAWTPQLHIDHRIATSKDSTLMFQVGILDPLTGELPAQEYSRTATAGERSRVPAQAIRVSWQRTANTRAATVGAGAYHASQDWGFGRTVDAWAVTTDWDVPLGRLFALSGEWYRGRAIGGLGGGASQSIMFDGPPTEPESAVRPVDTVGGWSQLKFKPATRIEFNAAFGQDNPVRTGLSRLLPIGTVDGSAVNRNASWFLNAIYQARSNLLFSVEYRRLWTSGLDDVTQTADQVSFSTGIGF